MRHPKILIAGLGLVALTAAGGVVAASAVGSSGTHAPEAGVSAPTTTAPSRSPAATPTPTPKPTPTRKPTPKSTRKPTPKMTPKPASKPARSDHDADNNGGPGDRDGNI